MIIDSHTHLSGPPYNTDSIIISYPDGGSFDLNIERRACHVDLLLKDMDDRGVDKALVMGIPECITNEQLSELVKKHPDRIIGFAGVFDPKTSESVRDLKAAVKQGLRGLKLHPDLHSFAPSDEEIVPLIQCAADLKVPTLIHSYPGGMRQGYFGKGSPEHIDTLKSHVPDSTIIIGHMGYPRYLDMITLGQIPGVYIETSWGLTGIAELNGLTYTSKLLRLIGIDNVLYGSDWVGPQVGMEMVRQLGLVEKLDLTREEKDKILGGNISKILGL